MLPTFVIGLREGLEAALIVGIIAAFLRKQGRRDLLRWVLIGIGTAIGLCILAGVALRIYSQNLPQRQQEGLETIIGVLAIAMVTYMVVWMRRNSRNLKGQLEGLAATAMNGDSGAGRALVLMAFLAVIREGVETVVFVLAAFDESGSSTSAGIGLLLGVALAVALGYGIYRGGVRINLSKFFRATGLVLVLVAAGILVNTLHTAHEAGWLNVGQSSPLDLTWLVQPGSVQASLLTGMLGIQPHPTVIEIVGWLLYLVPVGLYVGWPPGKGAPARLLAAGAAGLGALAGVAALVLALLAPSNPAQRPVTRAGALTAQVVERQDSAIRLRTQEQQPVARATGPLRSYRLAGAGSEQHAGVSTDVYRTTLRGTGAQNRSATLTAAQAAQLNGGRLPIGLGAAGNAPLPAEYTDALTLTAWLDTRTERVVDVSWSEQVHAGVRSRGGTTIAIAAPVAEARAGLSAAAVHEAAAQTRADRSDADRRSGLLAVAAWCLVLAVAALVVAASMALAGRRRERAQVTAADPGRVLARS